MTLLQVLREVTLSAGAISLAVGFSGCGTVPDEARTMAVGTLSLSDKSGPVGLTIIRPGAEFTLTTPNNRREAAHAMSVGATNVTAASQLGILFPAAFVVGGFEGLLFGTSDPELRRMTATIEMALRESQPVERIARNVAAQLASPGPDRVRFLADNLPLDPAPTSQAHPAPHPLRNSPIETLVGVRVSFLGLQVYTPPDLASTGDFNRTRHEHNPLLSLVLAVDVASTRPRDWSAAGGVTATYESVPHRFRDWSADDARLIRHELELALQFIERTISHRITAKTPQRP